jgi:hypothetical protein
LLSYCARHHGTVTTPAGGSPGVDLEEIQRSRCPSGHHPVAAACLDVVVALAGLWTEDAAASGRRA